MRLTDPLLKHTHTHTHTTEKYESEKEKGGYIKTDSEQFDGNVWFWLK